MPFHGSPDDQYHTIPSSDDGQDIPPTRKRLKRDRFLYSPQFPWIITTIFFLCLSSVLYMKLLKLQRFGTFNNGFRTEFDASKATIQVFEVPFTGTIKYSNEGQLYMDLGPEGTAYFGKPSPEIDQAWDELVGTDIIFTMSEKEAKSIPGDAYNSPGVGYIIEPDVFHSLHCVNAVRKILDTEYYFNTSLNEMPRIARLHIEHCLNHIRQSIQCHMDLTPTTVMYFENVKTEVGNFDHPHVCRNISKLHEWTHYRQSLDLERNISVASPKGHLQGYFSEELSALPWKW